MNYPDSKETRGFNLQDYVEVTTGAVPVQYTVGTQANAAIAGSWPLEGSLPQESQRILMYAAEDTLVSFIPLWILGRQVAPQQAQDLLPPGLPVFKLVPAKVLMEFIEHAIYIIYVQKLKGGTLDIWIEG
jgi:hypothetical protein